MSGQKKKLNQDLILSPLEIEAIEAHADPVVKKLYGIYKAFTEDPSKGWLNTVNFCQQEIRTLTVSKQLDVLKDGYHKSLWEILKAGQTVAKTISSAKQEANVESVEPEETTAPVPVISAETAHV